MTKPKPIRLTSTRLPPLTPAQRERVRLFRQTFREHGKIHILRKGQKPGHILITTTFDGQTRYYQYDRDAQLTAHWQQPELVGLTETSSTVQPTTTNPYTGE